MKRTNYSFKNYQNLVYKIAWGFHQTTGIELDELIQEASLAFCEGLKHYDSSRGKVTTFMWLWITDYLKNYVKKQNKHHFPLLFIEDLKYDEAVSKDLIFESLSREAGQIADIVLNTPKMFIGKSPEEATKRIINVLDHRGWDMKRIWSGIQDLKLAFK
jgi:DNA-directed RNA polymerase specialized sigma subunit